MFFKLHSFCSVSVRATIKSTKIVIVFHIYTKKPNFGTVSQWAEKLTFNQHVVGSIPTGSVRPAHYRIDERMRSMPRRKK